MNEYMENSIPNEMEDDVVLEQADSFASPAEPEEAAPAKEVKKPTKKKKPTMEDLKEPVSLNCQVPKELLLALKTRAAMRGDSIGAILESALAKPLARYVEMVRDDFAEEHNIKRD